MRKTLNIIGCGNVGKVLGRLWTASGAFTVQDILNRSLESSARAVDFIGAGHAVGSIHTLRPADIYLIGTPDDEIERCCQDLASAGLIEADKIVFHCSGALPSDILRTASQCGAHIASIHPIRSFAGPEQVASSFAGTWCGAEGNIRALEVLDPAFARIGAQLVPINAECKTIYHSAAVFASNYLVTLLDVAVEAYAKSGVPREVGLKMLEPLVRGTVDNVFRLGTTEALTGPIERGDITTVVRQYRAVNAWDANCGLLYKQMGKITSDIAARKRSRKSEV